MAPKKPKKKAEPVLVTFLTSPEERDTYQRFAAMDDRSMAYWIRKACERQARLQSLPPDVQRRIVAEIEETSK